MRLKKVKEDTENKALSVSQITNLIKVQLEEGIGTVSVQGEISNFKEHSSGHRYFSLKDENATISCTMWRSRALNFAAENGMKVIVNGRLTVYPPRGNYQIDVTSMSPLGQGDLYLAFEALKRKLEEKGYFEFERKRPIPVLPLRVGIATSPTGAAVRDMFSTIERRFPGLEIYFRPTPVQGEGAAEDIVRAINELNETDSQMIIIGRGGGSLEDLWAFNMEIVADAIFNSGLPVISAVGHETDFTIADFVADIRAATPTAAGEIATPKPADEVILILNNYIENMSRRLADKISDFKEQVDFLTGPAAIRRLKDKISIYTQQIDDLEYQSSRSMKLKVNNALQKVESLRAHCRSLEPLSPLKRGFALPMSEGKIIPRAESLVNYKKVHLVRDLESAELKVMKILPKPLF